MRVFLLALLLGLIVAATAVTAQQTTLQTTPGQTPLLTVQVTLPAGTPPPVSLSGVGATPLYEAVRIRSGPGLLYPGIGSLRAGGWIDVVGYNGYDLSRTCSPTFAADLDMWIQVVYRGKRGWIARCTVRVVGNLSRLPIVGAPEASG